MLRTLGCLVALHVLSPVAIAAQQKSSALASAPRVSCADSGATVNSAPCTLRSPQVLPDHNAWRTGLELGGVYGAAVVAYFADGRARQIDRAVLDGIAKIFSLDRLRFDDNTFELNNLSHPFGGLLYYGIPRANGASATRSFLTLVAASAFWEQVVELQEIASINDHLATPLSGWTIAEATFQARMFFRRGQPTLVNQLLDRIAGFPVNLSELAHSRNAPARAASIDAGGFALDVEPRFRFQVGMSEREAPDLFPAGRHVEVGVEAEIENLGRRNLPGDRAGWFRGTAATRFELGLSFQDGRINQALMRAKVIPLAWYRHRMMSEQGRLRGYRMLAGPAGEFELEMLGDGHRLYVERIAAYMLGASFHLDAMRSGAHARLVLDGYANFAQVASTGRLGHPDAHRPDESSAFNASNGYNAFGPSAAAALSVRYGWAELSAQVRAHRLHSIESTSRDRSPQVATNIRPKHDDWTTFAGGVALRPVRWLEFSLTREERRWSGAIDNFQVDKRTRSWSTRVSAAI